MNSQKNLFADEDEKSKGLPLEARILATIVANAILGFMLLYVLWPDYAPMLLHLKPSENQLPDWVVNGYKCVLVSSFICITILFWRMLVFSNPEKRGGKI